MPLSGGGNKWTDHVRAFANSKGVPYMCAMSDPACSATYKGTKPPKAVKAKKSTKKEQRENITMSMEDKPAPARKEALGDIFESATPVEGFNSPAVRAVLKNKGSLNKALEKKITDQQGMLAEDVNRALPDTKGKKAGRPKKYADPETARQAKIANTIRRAKERVSEKKDSKMTARIERAKKEYNRWLEQIEGNIHSDQQGNRIEDELIRERTEKMRKKYPSLKDSDWYRPIVLKQSTGKGFNVGTTKTGGMLGWVKSVIGRHPKLTPQQIRDAEIFATDLMADPTGISFEGASRIPLEVRKELAQELYNRSTMAREDKDAVGSPAEAFADEIRKQYESQRKGRGRTSKAYGFENFVGGLVHLNPAIMGVHEHYNGGNTPPPPAKKTRCSPVRRRTPPPPAPLPPAPVLPLPIPFAPLPPAPPQDAFIPINHAQRYPNMNNLLIQRPAPRRPKGGATALQKGLSAEMRSYTRPPLQHDLNQIIHSNDAPTSKFGTTPNAYRDHTNQFDPKAQKQIDRAIAVLVKRGIIPTGAGLDNAHLWESERRLNGGFLHSGSAQDLSHLSLQQQQNLIKTGNIGGSMLGADPRTYTPAYLSQSEGAPIFTGDYRGPEVQAERKRLTDEYFRRQMNGGAVVEKDVLNNYSTIIDHLVSHITDPKEPVDTRDYDHTIRLINGIRQLKGGYMTINNNYLAKPLFTPNYSNMHSDPIGTNRKFNEAQMKYGNEKARYDMFKRKDEEELASKKKMDDLKYSHYSGSGYYGGADQPPPPPPPPTPEEAEPDDNGMAGIDWNAIGEALLQQAEDDAEGYTQAQGRNARKP